MNIAEKAAEYLLELFNKKIAVNMDKACEVYIHFAYSLLFFGHVFNLHSPLNDTSDKLQSFFVFAFYICRFLMQCPKMVNQKGGKHLNSHLLVQMWMYAAFRYCIKTNNLVRFNLM